MDESFRCRKCGCFLFSAEHLISNQKVENEESAGFTQWFLKHETACPDWAEQAILKEQYTRGKLVCPKCMGRVGAFDFVGKREHYQLGPVWVQKCRVDLMRRIPVRPAPQKPALPPAACREATSERNTEETSETETSDMTLRGVTMPPHGDRATESDDTHPTDAGQSGVTDAKVTQYDVTEQEQTGTAAEKDTPATDFDAVKRVEDGLSADSEVETAYTCPICLDVLFQAHTCRPCLHVYCAPCLRRLSGASPFSTKCPLCRQVIAACLPNHEMSNLVKSVFPKQYSIRNALERKSCRSLPALPRSGAFRLTNFNRHQNRNYVFPQWAGICFVLMLIIVAIAVMATTIGMILWYLWETFMDYFIDGLVSINDYFDYSWQLIIMILLEKSDEISPELAKKLAGSFGQVLHAVGKLFNRSVGAASDHVAPSSGEGEKPAEGAAAADMNYVISAFQVDLANYVLVMCVVTYLIYRFARYRQARQVETTQIR